MNDKRRKLTGPALAASALLGLASCGSDDAIDPTKLPLPDIVATNAFYYYDELDTAWSFYTDVLGLETVIDYGFAKILRVADSSYVTLVNAADGMHSSQEPKTVTLAIFTDDLADWHAYFGSQGIVTPVSFDPRRDEKPASFVIEDPEGYKLRFQDAALGNSADTKMQVAANVAPVEGKGGKRPRQLGIRGTMYELHMRDMATTLPFYRKILGAEPVFSSDWASVFQMSGSSFVGLVNGGDDLHSPTEQNGVTLSLFTSDVDGWLERASNTPEFEMRTDGIMDESGMVRVFVGYDPEGYFLEWDTFLERPDNMALLRYLSH
jgi:catechol 2,3-dioxygenase-like lactoylglutathione lyase family enzyme